MVISGGLIEQTAIVRRKARAKDIDKDRAWCEWCVALSTCVGFGRVEL